MKYRKRPVVIDAVQFTGTNHPEVCAFFGGEEDGAPHEHFDSTESGFDPTFHPNFVGGCVEIYTLEGVMTADEGDWIIRGVQGEFYPCKPDIFEATYEPVES